MGRERSAAAPARRASKSAAARRRGPVVPARTAPQGAGSVLDGAEPTVEGLFHLQRAAGNKAVAALLARLRPVQRDTMTVDAPAAVHRGPSDIDLGFNALDTAHRLIEAINQSQLKLLEKGDPGFVAGVNPIARQINFTVVHDQLAGLTANQVKEVEARYLQYEGRALYVDLLGRGQSGAPPNLTVEQVMRLKALLGGTRAEIGEDPEIAAQHQREADAYELRGLLKGNPKGDATERVMTLVRRSPDEGQLLVRLYDGNWNLNADLMRMGYPNALRAMMLLSGSHTAADAYAISQHHLAIIEIDQKSAELNPPWMGGTDVLLTVGFLGGGGLAAANAATMASLKAQRRSHVDAIEERVRFTAEEARTEAEAGGEDVLGIDEAIRGRVAQVLGGDHATERVIGGTQGKLIDAIARADPPEQAAAELRKLEERGQLTTEVIAERFRRLRQQAEVEAARLYPDDTGDELAEHTRQLSDQWFIHLRTTWDASVVGPGRTFDQLLDRGDQPEVDLKRTLYMASGRLAEVDELVLALRGNRKDLESVKRVLRNKTRLEIDELKRLYKIKTTTATNTWGGSLDEDLLGFAPSRAGQQDTTEPDDPTGKAQGTDRLLIEDYLQRPYDEGGKEEVDYVVGRAEREHEYTIANRGATGWWRDHWGNEAKSLLDATLEEVREKRDQYYALTESGTDREAMRSRAAKLLIRDMHFARATIRGDRAGYEKATAKLRATFQAVASFVLQAVLTAVLTPAAAALFRGIGAAAAASRYGIWLNNTVVSLSSTIAANKAVYGNEYTREMLFADLRGGLSGAIGSAAVGKLVDPIAGRLQSRLGQQMTGEFIEGVKSYGGLQATAVLAGDGLVSFDEFAQQHFLGKVGERITGVTAKGLEHVGYGPGPTHPPYVPEEETRARPGTVADGTGPSGELAGPTLRPAPEPEADGDVDEAPTPVPMALPPELTQPAPRTPAPPKEQSSSGADRSQGPEEPPKTTPPEPVQGPEPANSDIDTKETALTPEMERTMLRTSEMARRAQQHPLDEASLRSSTAPTDRTRALAAEFAPLFEQFKTVTDVVPRSQLIAEVIRKQLGAEGVHQAGVLPQDLGDHTGAEFNVVTWQIAINSRLLAPHDLTVQQFSNLIEAAVHEARHALHHWRGLRVAVQDPNKFRSDSQLKPNPAAVAAARAANTVRSPQQDYSELAVKEAWEVYEQTFGQASADTSGERGRARIIAEREARQAELDVAKAAAAEAEKLPAGSTRREAAKLAVASAYQRWRAAYHRYLQLPQEIDAFRRGMAMNAAMVEALTIPKRDTARQAARSANADQVTAERRGDKDAVRAAQARYDAAVADYRRLSGELENLPHRTGQHSTLEQDYAFAKEARTQAQKDYLRARAAEDQARKDDALARFKEAAQEMRNIREEMDRRTSQR